MIKLLKLLIIAVIGSAIFVYLPTLSLYNVLFTNELTITERVLLCLFLTGICAALIRVDIDISSTEQDLSFIEKLGSWSSQAYKSSLMEAPVLWLLICLMSALSFVDAQWFSPDWWIRLFCFLASFNYLYRYLDNQEVSQL